MRGGGREAGRGGRVERAEGGYAQRPGEGARACLWGWDARREREDGSGASRNIRPEKGKAMEHPSHRDVGGESSISFFFFFSRADLSLVCWRIESVEPRRRLSVVGLFAPKAL